MLRYSSNLLKHFMRINSRNCCKSAGNGIQINTIRKCHAIYYRGVGPAPPRAQVLIGDAFFTIMWWWVLWHLWHEHEHLTGEFEYPDASKWSNKELGIPPDN